MTSAFFTNQSNIGGQLTLDLPHEPRLEIDDFLVGTSNEVAYDLITRWPDWSHPVLRLEGPKGSGKTHLAHIWSKLSHAWVVNVGDVTLDRIPELLAPKALIVENADHAQRDEAALFHLLNAASEHKATLLFTSRKTLNRWGVSTPDVLSRLRLAPVVTLGMPDDALFRAVLVKLFVDRQLIVNTSVIDYLAMHLDRSFALAQHTVEMLDKIAMEKRRPLSRALAAEYMASLRHEAQLL